VETDQSALLKAIQTGDTQTVTALLSLAPGLLHASMENGLSPVLTAVHKQQPFIAGLLIERGAPLDIMGHSSAARMLEQFRQ